MIERYISPLLLHQNDYFNTQPCQKLSTTPTNARIRFLTATVPQPFSRGSNRRKGNPQSYFIIFHISLLLQGRVWGVLARKAVCHGKVDVEFRHVPTLTNGHRVHSCARRSFTAAAAAAGRKKKCLPVLADRKK